MNPTGPERSGTALTNGTFMPLTTESFALWGASGARVGESV